MNGTAVRAAAPAAWRSEALGAFSATAAMLPFVLTFGYIVFGGLGERAGQVGLTASVVAVVLGGLAMTLFSRTRMPTASPSASASLILGGAVLSLLQDPALAPTTTRGLSLLLACTSAIVVLNGCLLAVLGLLKAGSLVRFVPQPVLAGFMNGVALLIVVSQVPPLLGLPAGAWAREGWRSLGDWQGLALGVALATALLMWAAGRRWPRAPAPLLAMIVAGLAVALWQQQGAPGSAVSGLQRIGTLSASLPQPDALVSLLDTAGWTVLMRHVQTIAMTALLLALIGALESVLSIAAIDQQLDERSDPNRELVALGGANVISGLFGGLPLVYLRLRALSTLAGGGSSRRSVWLGCALLAGLFTLGLDLLEPLSTAVVAGVVVMLAWTLVDRWTRQLLSQWWAGERTADMHWSLAVVALVCGVTLFWGFVAGVAAGVLAAMLIFMRAMNRQLVRTRYRATVFPSRRVWSPSDEAGISPQREGIEVLELEGALFFGSADRLAREAESHEGGRPTALTDLIIDLRRVTTIDASGAVVLLQTAQRLARRGVTLRLAGVASDNRHGRALLAHGVTLTQDEAATGKALLCHADADHAIEAAERCALQRVARHATGPLPWTECHLVDGLTAAQQVELGRHLRQHELDVGQRLFAQGDAGDAVYLLASGSVSVVDPRTGQRFASFSPGMCFGETAVLDGGGRTADALADLPSTVFELRTQAFETLQREHPALAALVYRNLATHLSQRLRAAAAAWRRAAE